MTAQGQGNSDSAAYRLFWDACEPGFGQLRGDRKGILHSVGAPNCPVMGGAERIGSVQDGLSNTLMIGELTFNDLQARSTFWAYGYTSYNSSSISNLPYILGNSFFACRDAAVAAGLTDNVCKRGFGSNHTNGLNFVFGDGSVRFIPYTVDMNLLAAMATVSGGEVADVR